MSLPLLHAGRTNPGLSAALDLRFALDKSLTAYRGPTPSFSRASTGSYFDGSGVLRYAALNTTLYSEDFSNAYWIKSNATISTNQTIAPDGKNTADLLYPSSTGAARGIYYASPPAKTISLYAKSSGKNWIALTDFSAATSAWFNLSNGTVGTVGAGYTAAIQNAGNGWYRCSLTKTTDFSYFQIYGTDSDNTLTATVNGTDGVFIWGAQAEASSTVGTYCPTTSSANSAPRFNHTYNGTSWVSRGLLVEEQRTNSLSNSEDFTVWASVGSGQTNSNVATAPNGATTADEIQVNSGSASPYEIYRSFSYSSNPYSISVYSKYVNNRWITLGTNAPGACVYFDILNGIVGTAGTGHSGEISNCGNGWYRLTVKFTGGSAGVSPYIDICVVDGNGVNSCTTGAKVLLWGAQIELGAFPTSYIPTTSASSTRSADVCQITGSDFSGFWNGTEGSIAVEFDRPMIGTATGDSMAYLAGNAGVSTYQIGTYLTSGDIHAFGYNSASIYDFNHGAQQAGVAYKVATAFKSNDFASSLNGATSLTDTSGSLGTGADRLLIGFIDWSTGARLNGHIARLRYYRKRLPNATLQLLSEPDPTLNLQFALNKSLTPVAGPAPSFSRASTGTYFNASGVLTSASINTPRFDHAFSGGQWVSRGLLLEEQRTNICLQSNTFNTTWLTLDGTVTANAATSPDGTNNAWKLNEASANSVSHGIYQPLTIGSGTYTWSVFAKAGERNWLQFLAYSSSTNYFTWFNLANGTVGTNAAGTTASIQDVGGGWYRCSVSRSTSSGTSYAQIYAANADNNGAYAGDPTKGIYIYGCQVEAGSFPTSYIGTTTSSVTRSADVCQITGTSFNWMWNQGEGSVVAEYDTNIPASVRNSERIVEVNDGSDNERITLFLNAANQGYVVTDGGVTQSSLPSSSAVSQFVATKTGATFKLNDFAVSYDGASVSTDTSGTMPSPTKMDIGYVAHISNRVINGHIAKLIYYPARLTNAKLQQLST